MNYIEIKYLSYFSNNLSKSLRNKEWLWLIIATWLPSSKECHAYELLDGYHMPFRGLTLPKQVNDMI